MKVYLGEVIHPAAVALLEKNAEVVRPKDHSRKAYLEALKDVDGMVARKVHVGAEEMNQAPRMKIIARHGVGLDSVDLEEATRRGILVTNTPGANRESVAELAITFMLSLARREKIARPLAMTGELTLTGEVLPIGGVREKVIAARRIRIMELILPEANRRDFEELPDHIREGVTVHYARQFKDVVRVVFG